jgi:indole-3-glycerol phosphate synthase
MAQPSHRRAGWNRLVGSDLVATILEELVRLKRQRLQQLERERPLGLLMEALQQAAPARDFYATLAAGEHVRVIAELKRASPSAGPIQLDCDPVQQARRYEAAGAAAISVLTEESRFCGSLEDLARVRATTPLPLLRKDFLVEPYQIYEARAAGADSVLLIAEVLNDGALLKDLIALARQLHMEPLVELYEPRNVERVLAAGARIVGVNNRDLRTFRVNLQQTHRVAPLVPRDCLLVAESGIASRAEVEYLAEAGVKAILVGESLMRAASPEALLVEWSSVPSLWRPPSKLGP